MCRVSTQITGSSAAVNALTSHCDSGPASIPIRPKDTPSEVRTAMISAGSVGIFRSKTTLPASSITHTDVAFTDTSRPAKWTILSLLPRGSRSADLKSTIVRERGRALIIDACRGRRDTPSVGSERGRSPERGATGETRRERPFLSSQPNRKVRPPKRTYRDRDCGQFTFSLAGAAPKSQSVIGLFRAWCDIQPRRQLSS